MAGDTFGLELLRLQCHLVCRMLMSRAVCRSAGGVEDNRYTWIVPTRRPDPGIRTITQLEAPQQPEGSQHKWRRVLSD